MPLVPSDGVGLCEELYEIYKSLSEGANFRNMVDDMSDLLMENCMAGNRIPKDRVPEYYRKKYGVNNLYRYRLARGYRGIYTILRSRDKIQVWILDLLNHDDYDRRFGYSTSF